MTIMGQAERRGTFEQRRAESIKEKGAKVKNLTAYEKRQIARKIYRELIGL